MMGQQNSGNNGICQLYHCGKPGSLQKKFPRGAYLFMKRLVRRVFGADYQYTDYILPFGKEVAAADRGANFAKLRVRSTGRWTKGSSGKRRGVKY